MPGRESSSMNSSPAPPRCAAPSRPARPASGASTSAPASTGGLEAGRRLGEICMGGLGTVTITSASGLERWPLGVDRAFDQSRHRLPRAASTPAGPSQDEESGFFALGSGPARALSRVEELYQGARLRRSSQQGGARHRGRQGAARRRRAQRRRRPAACRPRDLTILYAPTGSLAGTVQIAARVLEVALHKAHALHFPLENIVDGYGVAPIAPPIPDFVKAMGRTNDAIIYGGRIQLFVRGTDDDAKKLAEQLPSSTCSIYGKPFAEIFAAVERRLLQDRRHRCSARRSSPSRTSTRARRSRPASSLPRSSTPASANESPSPRSRCREWGEERGAMNKPVQTSELEGAASKGPRIVLFVEEGGGDWHARRLAQGARGPRRDRRHHDARRLAPSIPRCHAGIDIPGFAGALPDGAFVRSVSTGTLEQITFRLGILHALARKRRARLERCPRHRALRRQIDGDVPVPEGRAADAGDARGRRL